MVPPRKWKNATPVERIEASLEVRLMVLIAKEKKDGADYKEIDLLGRQSSGSRACASMTRRGRNPT